MTNTQTNTPPTDDQLESENERYRKALEDIANNVYWGIQYRYKARDALQMDNSIDLDYPAGMAFDEKGEPVTDYGPEHDPELLKRLGVE